MADDTKMPIVRRMVSHGRIFYSNRIDTALDECYDAGYSPLFMPDLILSRLESDLEYKIWDKNLSFSTASVRGIGKTKAGLKVVVYAHIPTVLSNPKNLRSYILNKEVLTSSDCDVNCFLVNVPKEEFHRILDLEDNQTVFVLDYKKFDKMSYGNMRISKMLKHPVTVPFLGVGKERAEEYLEKHVKVYGKAGINYENGEWKKLIDYGSPYWVELDNLEYSFGLLGIGERLGNHFLFNLYRKNVSEGRFIGIPNDEIIMLGKPVHK